MPLVSDRQAMHESPQINIDNQFFYRLYAWVETQTTHQRQCNHGRRAEANVGQQYRQGPDCLAHQMLTVPTTINPEKILLWDPKPGPSSPSRTYMYD